MKRILFSMLLMLTMGMHNIYAGWYQSVKRFLGREEESLTTRAKRPRVGEIEAPSPKGQPPVNIQGREAPNLQGFKFQVDAPLPGLASGMNRNEPIIRNRPVGTGVTYDVRPPSEFKVQTVGQTQNSALTGVAKSIAGAKTVSKEGAANVASSKAATKATARAQEELLQANPLSQLKPEQRAQLFKAAQREVSTESKLPIFDLTKVEASAKPVQATPAKKTNKSGVSTSRKETPSALPKSQLLTGESTSTQIQRILMPETYAQNRTQANISRSNKLDQMLSARRPSEPHSPAHSQSRSQTHRNPAPQRPTLRR